VLTVLDHSMRILLWLLYLVKILIMSNTIEFHILKCHLQF
jgi:hypothetical protein